MKPLSILLDAIAPPRCIECRVPLSTGPAPLCSACHVSLPWWRFVDGCPRCGTSTGTRFRHESGDAADNTFEGCPGCLAEGSALHGCLALTRYEGVLRRWIPGFKTARSPFGPVIPVRLAIDHLARELARRVAEETSSRPDLIVSVPLHRRRRRARGFNQANPIARRISEVLGLAWTPHALIRVRDTHKQASLGEDERRENVQDAFRATRHLGTAKHVWLVDDVLTTGNTLDAAADALLEAGVFEVRALTLAATLPGGRAPRRRDPYHAPQKRSVP